MALYLQHHLVFYESIMSSSIVNGSQDRAPTKPLLEADIALLQNLLSEDVDDSNADSENVAELLKRLEAAEGLADGVEERLDGIMGHLDTLLTDLEAKQVSGTAEAEEVVGGLMEGEAEPQDSGGTNAA